MSKVAQFTGDADRRWKLQNVWRGRLLDYACLCRAAASCKHGTDEHRRLMHEEAAACKALFERAAELELQVEKQVRTLEVNQTIDTVTGNLTGVHIDKIG